MSEAVQGVLILALCGFIFLMGERLPFGGTGVLSPAFFPQLVAGTGALLGALILVRGVVALVRRRHAERTDEDVSWTDFLRKVCPITVVSALFIWSIGPLGFLLSSFLFLLAILLLLGERRWLVLAVVPVLLSGGVFLIFNNLLKIRLATGSLFG